MYTYILSFLIAFSFLINTAQASEDFELDLYSTDRVTCDGKVDGEDVLFYLFENLYSDTKTTTGYGNLTMDSDSEGRKSLSETSMEPLPNSKLHKITLLHPTFADVEFKIDLKNPNTKVFIERSATRPEITMTCKSRKEL